MLISKTSYLKGRQCPKRLWFAVNGRREPKVEPDEVLEDRELDGAVVERVAESLFPEGISIAPPADDDEAKEQASDRGERVARTQALLGGEQTLFQAHLEVDGLLAITDVLERRDDGWFLWEVKSSTHKPDKKPKALYDWDLAFQVQVARGAGLEVVGAGLLLLKADFVRGAGEPDPRELIVKLDRSEVVMALQDAVRADLDRLRDSLAADTAPAEWPGPRCKGSRSNQSGDRPSTCGHLRSDGECGRHLPTYWAGTLPNLQGAKASYIAATRQLPIERLDPDDPGLGWTEAQQRVIRAAQSGEPEIDRGRLKDALDEVQWPVAYVDFEFDPGMAVPRFQGTRPYDRIPFQWAMAVQAQPGSPLGETRQFLWLEQSDPRRDFAEALLDALPREGSIVAHHESAETTVLKQLAVRLGGDLEDRLEALVPRFLDTKKIASAGYYHPDQHGSYSIKKLAEPLVGRGYEDLEIKNGMLAVSQWRRACDPSLAPEERERQRKNLEAYCGRDAVLMHEILEQLRLLCNWRPSAPRA
jgi:hypothetical protein